MSNWHKKNLKNPYFTDTDKFSNYLRIFFSILQCSSGFIADPRNKKLVCPDCRAMSCAKCLLPVSSRITHWNIPFPSYHFVLCNTYLLWVVCMTTIVEFKVKKATWSNYFFYQTFFELLWASQSWFFYVKNQLNPSGYLFGEKNWEQLLLMVLFWKWMQFLTCSKKGQWKNN